MRAPMPPLLLPLPLPLPLPLSLLLLLLLLLLGIENKGGEGEAAAMCKSVRPPNSGNVASREGARKGVYMEGSMRELGKAAVEAVVLVLVLVLVLVDVVVVGVETTSRALRAASRATSVAGRLKQS